MLRWDLSKPRRLILLISDRQSDATMMFCMPELSARRLDEVPWLLLLQEFELFRSSLCSPPVHPSQVIMYHRTKARSCRLGEYYCIHIDKHRPIRDGDHFWFDFKVSRLMEVVELKECILINST